MTEMKDTICYQLHVKMPGTRRMADKSIVDLGGSDPELMNLSKAIFDSDKFRSVERHVRFMKAYLESRSVPSTMLRGGFYDVPIDLVEEIVAEVEKLKATFDGLVDAFLVDYKATLIPDARDRLGEQFKERDYLTSAKMKEAFFIETRFIETSTPTKLRTVSEAVYAEAVKKSEARLEVQRETVIAVMRAQMKEFIDAMVSQLGVREDGRKKQFRVRSVEKLGEFLKYSAARNVTNDVELAALTTSAADLLQGLDVAAVKKDAGYREAVKGSFEIIQGRLGKLVGDAGRSISFESEETEAPEEEVAEGLGYV